MTYSNDTPYPVPESFVAIRSSQALLALYTLRVIPGMMRHLAHAAVNVEGPAAGDQLVWIEAAIRSAFAVYQEERLALLRQTPLARVSRN